MKRASAVESHIEVAPLSLRAEVRAESVDAEARTVDVIFSTGAPVHRFDWMSGQRYIETLSLKKSHVRLDRLNNSAPFLNAHSSYSLADVIGVVVPGSARVVDGQAIATIRMSKRDEVEPIWRDMQDGIVRNVSVGYRVHKYEQTEASEGKPAIRHAVDWEPYEISAVPMGADDGAKVRGADDKTPTNPCVLVSRTAEETPVMEPTRAIGDPAEVEVRNAVDPGAPTPGPEPEARAAAVTDQESGAAAERARIQGIIRAVRNGGLPTNLSDQLIREGATVEHAQSVVLDEVAKKFEAMGPRAGGYAVRDGAEIRMVGDPGLHVRSGIENALLHRTDPKMWPLTEVGRLYAGSSLIECAKLCLQSRGVRTTGLSPMAVAGAALGLDHRAGYHTTSDFPSLLEDVANKTLRRGYEEAPATYGPITRQTTARDFKPIRRVQIGEAPSLLQVNEHGEFTSGTIGEGKETYQLATYGRTFPITRQALINDDTDAFSRLTMMFGRTARHKISDLVWAQITSNPTMGDNVALFDAAHVNIDTVNARPNVVSLGLGRSVMRQQRGVDGVQYLNLVPRYLIVSPDLETEAQQLTASITPQVAGSVNPFAGLLQVIAEPRLMAVNSGLTWYLAADPGQIDILELAFLEGQEGPVVETQMGFRIDGVEVKCRLDVASKAIDWRGLYRNDGSAS